jgi:hypothetical protein
MNSEAGARKGRCTVRQCVCRAYAWSASVLGRPSCECSHPYRAHAQVWGEQHLVTVAGWDVGAA